MRKICILRNHISGKFYGTPRLLFPDFCVLYVNFSNEWTIAFHVCYYLAMDYTEERDIKYLNKLRDELLPCLPSFCRDFFVGIGMRTTALTRYNYATDLKLFFEYTTLYGAVFEGMNVGEITLKDMQIIEKRDIERFLDYIDSYYSDTKNTYVKNKDSAKARKLSAVRSLFAYLYKSDLLSENVTLKVDVPKIREKEIIRLEDAEVGDVLGELSRGDTFSSVRKNNYNNNNTKIRDNAIVTLLLGTGIRVSECVGLNVKDIDFVNNSFTVTRKGEKRAILYFSGDIAAVLSDYLDFRAIQLKKHEITSEPEALFLSLRNKRISVRAVELVVKKYAESVTPLKKITPHKLRSTYGTALYRATKDIYVVAEVLGHRDINTTKKHYAALGEDIKKEAADKVKFKKSNNSDIFSD